MPTLRTPPPDDGPESETRYGLHGWPTEASTDITLEVPGRDTVPSPPPEGSDDDDESFAGD